MHATHSKTEQKLQLQLISHIIIMLSPIHQVYYEPYSKAHLLIVTTEAQNIPDSLYQSQFLDVALLSFTVMLAHT
jgi:hypothetical protein